MENEMETLGPFKRVIHGLHRVTWGEQRCKIRGECWFERATHMKNLQTPICLFVCRPHILCSVLGLAIATGSSRAPPSAPTSTIEVAAAAALVAAVAFAAAAAAGFVDAVLRDGKQ